MKDIAKIASQLNSLPKLPISKIELEQCLEMLFHDILFPICSKHCKTERHLMQVYSILYDNISNLIPAKEAKEAVNKFTESLPKLQAELYTEAENFLSNDPAAQSIEEIILTYPGFYALVVYKLSHFLYKIKVPIVPRLFSEYAHSKVGIDISPGATIGHKFFIDHGTGIVIGETTVIGNNVKIYQGVTLGALFVTKSMRNTKRHPTIDDNVVIYAGATILGGDTVVGHDSTIGGNVWLTKSVPPHSLVIHSSDNLIRKAKK